MIWIVSHDAGGAEILSAWSKKEAREELRFVLEGPALKVFERKLGPLNVSTRLDLEGVNPESDRILTGTGWASDLEKYAIRVGLRRGVFVASFLDHWVSYRERFLDQGHMVLPDEIWVGDDNALELARLTFPGQALRKVENPYFEEMKQEMLVLERSSGGVRSNPVKIRILYVCEAISEHWTKRADTSQSVETLEFEAIRGFLKWVSLQGLDSRIEVIRFRTHPAEAPGKYSQFLQEIEGMTWEMSSGTSLLEDCAWADWVVGMSSMALVIGVIAGKKVYSRMPLALGVCPLPQREIVRIPPDSIPCTKV